MNLDMIAGYLDAIKAEDRSLLAKLSPEHQTPLTRRHRGLTPKTGRPPLDYLAVELVADLEAALVAKDEREALILFAMVSRIFPV